MKIIISLIVGVAAFIGVFFLTGALINFIVSGATGDTRVILKTVLWLFGFSWTFVIGIGVGIFTGKIISILLGEK